MSYDPDLIDKCFPAVDYIKHSLERYEKILTMHGNKNKQHLVTLKNVLLVI